MSSTQNIWNLLVSSGLVPSENVAEIRTDCEDALDSDRKHNPDDVLNWLLDQNRISGYQMQLLAEGQPGPFRFEQYRVHGKNSDGVLDGSFRAQHISSNHPVRIYFFGGSTPEDSKTWMRIRQFSGAISQITSPFVSRCFEFVEDGEYRFVVFEDQPGKSLSSKLPYKARLPWPQTLQAIELMAIGLSAIHSEGLAHGRIWPGSIWLQRGGICQLLWQIPDLNFDPDMPVELAKIPLAFQSPSARTGRKSTIDIAQVQRDDLFSLGAMAFRMISGKLPKIKSDDIQERNAEIDKHLVYCEKYNLPDNVLQLIRLLLTADISTDLKDAEVTAKLTGTILESQSIKSDFEKPSASLVPYEQSLGQKNRSQGFLDTLESIDTSQIAEFRQADKDSEPNFANVVSHEAQVTARERLSQRRNQKQNRLPLMLGGSILGGAILIAAVLGGLFSPKADSNAGPASNKSTPDNTTTTDPTSPDDLTTEPSIIEPVVFRPQNIVDDNDNIPWESPTGGRPIDVRFMPAAPDFLLALRPRRMTGNENATRLIKALGPRFETLTRSFTRQTGVTPAEIERLNLSLHSGEQGRYEFVVVSELAKPISQDEFRKRMGEPVVTEETDAGFTTFEIESNLVFFMPNEDQTVTHFGFGPAEFLKESFDSMGSSMAGRTVSQLIERSDRDRDVSLIFRTAALPSEEGKWLFSGGYAAFRRPLSLFFDDRTEGVKLSVHFDNGSYLEWMSQQTTEMSDRDMAEWLPRKFEDLRDRLTNDVRQIPPHPYWARVQQRFDNMLNEFVKQIRVGREQDGVIANCWLPEVAPHNLLVAGELVMNGSSFTGGSEPVYDGPTSLKQLLETKRDLTVASDPDLINLLREIEQEIKDDFPKLPFKFRIRLLGNDLAVEGITQNQRPGNFEAKQTPLGEILAQIMFRANSDKNATSPSDIRCKLVWVIGPDPDDPAIQAVLVTTRSAVADRKMTLPALFQIDPEN